MNGEPTDGKTYSDAHIYFGTRGLIRRLFAKIAAMRQTTDHAIEAIRQVERASVSIGLFTGFTRGPATQHDTTQDLLIDAMRIGERPGRRCR
jgi:hypothetical protein